MAKRMTPMTSPRVTTWWAVDQGNWDDCQGSCRSKPRCLYAPYLYRTRKQAALARAEFLKTGGNSAKPRVVRVRLTVLPLK